LRRVDNTPLIVIYCFLKELAVVVGLQMEWPPQFGCHRMGTSQRCSAIAPTSPVLLCSVWMWQEHK